QKSAEGFGKSVAADILPSLNKITDAMVEAQKESGLLYALLVGFGGLIAEGFNLNPEPIEQIDEKLGELNTQLEALEQIDENGGFWKLINDLGQNNTAGKIEEVKNQIRALNKERKQLEEGSRNAFEAPKFSGPDLGDIEKAAQAQIESANKV